MSKGDWLLGDAIEPDRGDFGGPSDLGDHKIAYVLQRCRDRDVLDIGCVQHNPDNYRSRYWLHGAIRQQARHVVGLDIYADGVANLRQRGFDVRLGDAQDFELGEKYDVIVAGDVIEHLVNADGFLRSCLRHLRDDGCIVVSTPNPWYWRNVAKAALFARVDVNPEHTLWLCPTTLAQLAARYGLTTSAVEFGSRYRRDRFMPLPRGLKHTSFHATLSRQA